MSQVFLLLIGQESCHDGDEWQGIFTDLKALRDAYMQLSEERGILKPQVYEFVLNDGNANYQIVSEKELEALWKE